MYGELPCLLGNIFFSMTYPRPRKSRDPKEQMRPRLTWRRTTHKTKTDWNIFLFAYANGTVVETCVSEGFHQIGGLKVSGYSARAERFFANWSGLEINLRSGSIFVSLWKFTFRRARRNENRFLAVAVREKVWEPLKLGLISGYLEIDLLAIFLTRNISYVIKRQYRRKIISIMYRRFNYSTLE